MGLFRLHRPTPVRIVTDEEQDAAIRWWRRYQMRQLWFACIVFGIFVLLALVGVVARYFQGL